ncbi:membrane-spanning 4-domains subfamily A member 4A-like [Trichomycterus rosablanca]|uniref:membrane-spanning 4-domains subfamily A member 4A-like n=1 Tax=Trichomycterus rosablanca TaxID=2290929 RepID=UPI002F354A24
MNPAPDPQHQLSFHTKFLKGEPKALGTVQIMIGVVTLMFGIVLSIKGESFIASTGITIWGSLIYISTGAVAVAASNNASYCLVNSSLKMNVISAIVAGIAIILLSLEVFTVDYRFYNYKYYKHLSQGISAVLLILSVMQFILSICISAFACKATCDSNSPARVVCVVRNQYAGTTVQSIPNTVRYMPSLIAITWLGVPMATTSQPLY